MITCPRCQYVGDLDFDFRKKPNEAVAVIGIVALFTLTFCAGVAVGNWL
jgi:hypothetical protein